jgi:phospholipid/cholesterol/gamma-HCH transport system substrate-binding protein
LGAAVAPVPSSANMSTQAQDFPAIAPLDVPAAPPAMHRPPTPPKPPAVIDGGGQPNAHPSSFGSNGSRPTPSVAVTEYDPRTGGYLGPDRKLYRQSDLVKTSAPKKWQDLFPT